MMFKNSKAAPIDQRALRTRRALVGALMELGPTVGLDQLQVSTLADAAGIGRSTFYAHYADKEDFLVTSYGAMVARFDEVTRRRPGDRSILPSHEVFHHVADARAFALSLVRSDGFARMHAAREAKLHPIAEANLARLYPDLTPARRRERAIFIAGAFSALMRWWLEGGLQQSAQAMHELFDGLVARLLSDQAD
jgi:AcrR family transcriptional regulator